MTMRMAVKVVSCMTLRTVACRSYRSIRCRVMTGCTGIMLLVVRRINKVSVINRHVVTADTFRLQRYLGCMILRRMSRKVARYAAVTLATVTRRCYRSVRCAVMTGRTVVML